MIFKLYLKPYFYTGYLLTKSSLKSFSHKSKIIEQLERSMSYDISSIYKEDIDWKIDSWIKPPRIKNPNYVILTHYNNYIASFRFHYEITNNLYNTVKVHKDKYMFISVVLVNPKHRGRGICKKLLSKFTNSKYDAVLRVLKGNDSAIKCYEKTGFTKIGQDKQNLIYIYKQTK